MPRAVRLPTGPKLRAKVYAICAEARAPKLPRDHSKGIETLTSIFLRFPHEELALQLATAYYTVVDLDKEVEELKGPTILEAIEYQHQLMLLQRSFEMNESHQKRRDDEKKNSIRPGSAA
jgi:hypothetical protein